MSKFKVSTINMYIFVIMFLSIYLTPYYVRYEYLNSFANINFIFILSLFIMIFINKNHIDYKKFTFISFIAIYIFVIDYFGNYNSIDTIIKNLSMYIIPLFLFCVKIKRENIKNIFSKSLDVVNIFTMIIFAIGILDPVIGFNIMRFIGENFTTELSRLIYENTILNPYRYTSYMGHALFTKELFLYFYFFNMIYYKKFNECKLNNILIIIISLTGVLLTGSKTGIILIIISILFTQYKKSKIFNVVMSLSIIFISYIVGFFNTIFDRLSKESITSGRYEAGLILKRLDIIKIKFFAGYGEYVDRIIAIYLGEGLTTASMEYPIKILAFKYGIFITIIFSMLVFIYPLIKLLRDREYYLLFAFCIKLIDVNTYNGLIYKADNMILFVLFTFLLLSLSSKDLKYHDKEKRYV